MTETRTSGVRAGGDHFQTLESRMLLSSSPSNGGSSGNNGIMVASVMGSANEVSTTGIQSSTNPTVFGESTTFTVTVSGNFGTPTGDVTLRAGATVIDTQPLDVNGQVAFTLSDLTAGTRSISAAYEGDATYDISSAGLAQVVNKADPFIAIFTSDSTTVFGDAVTFTATVTSNSPGSFPPDGDIEFFDGSFSIGIASLDTNGVASLELSDLAVGSHHVTAVYTGSTSFNSGTSAGSAHVTVGLDTSTTTIVSVSPTTLFSDTAEFQATVVSAGGGSVTGDVEFFDDTTSLGSATLDEFGVAILDITTLPIGQHTISAVYAGDVNVGGSDTATPSVVEVTNNPPTTIGLSDVDVNQDASDTVVGLHLAFADIEDQTSNLVFTVSGNTNTGLITATISDQALTLSYATGHYGSGNITIRATDTYNDYVETTFAVSVAHVPAKGAIQFASAAASTAEGAGMISLIVARIGGSEGVVSAQYAVSGGTASADDYAFAAGTVTFVDGEISKTISIAANDDAIDEDDETVTVTLSNPTGGATLGVQASTTLTIIDNQGPAAGDRTDSHRPGYPMSIAPLPSTSDPEGDLLNLSIVSGPSHGSVVVDDRRPADPTGLYLNYMPDATSYGNDSIVYQVDDGHGHTATGTITIKTEGVGLVESVLMPGTQDLIVIGTDADDNFQIYAWKNTKEVKVTNGDSQWGHVPVTGRVIAFGMGGNDAIQAKYIKQAVIFSGGDGNDRLTGAGSKDILVGGDGDDRLKGAEKRDLMIGGNGVDRIDGGAPDDIVIGGTTAFDALATSDQISMIDIVSVWNAAGKRAARQKLIGAGVGTTMAKLNDTTVFSDNEIDDLGKATSKNWIFGDTASGIAADLVRGRLAA